MKVWVLRSKPNMLRDTVLTYCWFAQLCVENTHNIDYIYFIAEKTT
jgi:hypothetical protein